MDITAAVREMNELADTLDHAMSRGAVVDPADLDRLAELIVSADEWIGCGGFPPNGQTYAIIRRAASARVGRAVAYVTAQAA